jgi:hypothetical protein
MRVRVCNLSDYKQSDMMEEGQKSYYEILNENLKDFYLLKMSDAHPFTKALHIFY